MKRKILIAGGIIIILGLGVIALMKLLPRREDGAISVSGNVEVTEAAIGFKLQGRIEALLADEGRKVAKGVKLASIESSEIRNQTAQSGAFLREMQTRLEEMKAGSRPQEVGQARAMLAVAEAELLMAKKDYERYSALFEKGVVPAERRDAVKRAYDVAVSRHQNSLQALSLVKEGARKEEIQAAESRVRQAESAVKAAEDRSKETELFAPFNGVVLRKNVEVGEIVPAGAPVYTIGDLEKPWVKVYVREDKLGLVKLGQDAEIKVDSYPGRVYRGKVTYISSTAEFTPRNVQTLEERVKLVFGIKVSVKNENDDLKPGMPADVRIMLK